MDYKTLSKEELIQHIQELESSNKTLQDRNNELVANYKKEHELLMQVRENYESFFNTIDDFLFVLDEQANIIHTNTTVLDRLGYTKEELYCNSVLMVHPKERWEEAGKIVGDMLQGNAEFCPVPIISKSGQQIPVETRVKAGLWNKKPVIFGVTKDISRLQLSEEKFSKVFLLNPSACGFSDLETGNYVEVNEAFCKLLGYTKDEVLGTTATALNILSDEERKRVLCQADANGNITNCRISLTAKNGDIKNALISSENMYIQDKQYRFTVVHDITKITHIEKELEVAMRRAEESDKLKSAFLANMSHEIRTPMNGILGFAELLKSPNLSGSEQQEFIEIIEKSGIRMLNIINDIIDISKIESGHVEVYLSESNINKQIAYIHTFFKPEVEAKGLKLRHKIPLPKEEAVVITDREKLYAILTNLVKNAIKYTNSGSIDFGYNKKGEFIEFFVKDTGIGICENMKDKIFSRFIQSTTNPCNETQGAGLGLAITKAYVEMLGGEIWMNSEQGVGSEFFFTIPYSQNKVDNIKNIDNSEDFNTKDMNLKILIAEDDQVSSMLLSTFAKHFSKEILCVDNGKDAVTLCLENPDINVILMDINMPVMNGFEATQEIRKFNKEVIIIAQTALGFAEDRKKALAVGCNDYLSKPIKQDKLCSVIEKYCLVRVV